MKLLDNNLLNLRYIFFSILEHAPEQDLLNFLNSNNIKSLVNMRMSRESRLIIENPIHIVVKRDFYYAIKKLINLGANINSQSNFGETPLSIAIERKNIKTIQLLLNLGAKVNFKNINGEYPLHIAVEKGEISIVNMLIASGGNINVRNHCKETSLHLAASYLNDNMIKLLLSHNANVNLQDLWHSTPFRLIATFNKDGIFSSSSLPLLPLLHSNTSNIIKYLIQAGADVSIKADDNLNPVDIIRNDYPILYNIIEKELKVYEVTKRNNTDKAANIFHCCIELSKTSLSEPALDKVINYLDSEKTFHDNVIRNLKKSAITVSRGRYNEKSVKDQEYNFYTLYKLVKENSIKTVLISEEQQIYCREQLFSQKSFVKDENIQSSRHR